MFRWTWKIRRVYKTAKRLALLLILLSVFMSFLKANHRINMNSWSQNLSQWIGSGLKILVASLSLYIVIKVFRWFAKRHKMKKANIYEIDKMTGEEFEHYLGYFFSQLGYKTKVTPLSGDHGADLILEKDGVKTVVQAKRYRNKVDNKAVQEVVASMKMYAAQKALCVTSSFYTKHAIELAKANNVELWDRRRLINELARMNISKKSYFKPKVI